MHTKEARGALTLACLFVWTGAGACTPRSLAIRHTLAGSTTPTGPPVAHASAFGEDVSDEACQALDRAAELADIEAGHRTPYLFAGPHSQCSNQGCLHNYYGKRGRFDGSTEPVCSETDRRDMIAWLANLAARDSQWAAEVLTMKPCDLWPQIRGRTVWVAGDSLSQDFMFALVTFMTEYWATEGRNISNDPGTMGALVHGTGLQEQPAWCFNMTQDSRICCLRANKAPRMASTVLHLLPNFADREKDVLILNFGAWYNYDPLADWMPELAADVPLFEEALRTQLPLLPKRIFWRESTAQHFDTVTGMFDGNRAIHEQRCAPPGSGLGVELEMRPDGSLGMAPDSGTPLDDWQLHILLAGGHRNRITQPVIDSLKIPTLRAWNISLMVDNVHRNYHRTGQCVTTECDCSHACRYSTKAPILVEYIQSRQLNCAWGKTQHLLF